MKTTQFISGISIFVQLIADIVSIPVRKGLPQGPPQSGINTGAATNYVSGYGPPTGPFPPVPMSNVAPPNYMTGPEPGSFQPSYYRDPMSMGAPVGPMPPQSGLGPGVSMPSQPVFVSGPSMVGQTGYVPGANLVNQPVFAPGASGPGGAPMAAQLAYTSSSSLMTPQPGLNSGGSQPVASVQSEGSDVNWAVPPKMFSDMSAPPGGPNQALAEESQFLPSGPLRQAFQSGELSHFEKNAESGASQSETEEVGYPPSSPSGPLPLSPEMMLSGPVGPRLGVGGLFGYPYPYFDLMFLTGQYPPGTVSHFSHNFEHGRDFYHDTHYTKEHSPGSGGPGGPATDQQSKVQPRQT